MAKRKSQILSERELQHHALAEQKVQLASLKEGIKRLMKAVSWGSPTGAGAAVGGRQHQC